MFISTPRKCRILLIAFPKSPIVDFSFSSIGIASFSRSLNILIVSYNFFHYSVIPMEYEFRFTFNFFKSGLLFQTKRSIFIASFIADSLLFSISS
ncbi:hypothetical protein FGO68_gene13853 [Halteria grandinella]|uniref:Uncharacterized protein n=1 Tax=Halteria grandinella TaxID=5974 RepID=A0A8J8P651_HALGN|nr:hypothetical protein FGO68_gene13853 [Halteria grandinella]